MHLSQRSSRMVHLCLDDQWPNARSGLWESLTGAIERFARGHIIDDTVNSQEYCWTLDSIKLRQSDRGILLEQDYRWVVLWFPNVTLLIRSRNCRAGRKR